MSVAMFIDWSGVTHVLSGSEFRILILMVCASLAGPAAALIAANGNFKRPRSRWIAIAAGLAILGPALVGLLWHLGIVTAIETVTGAAEVNVSAYVMATVLVSVGYAGWRVRADLERRNQAARVAAALASSIAIGVGLGIFLHTFGKAGVIGTPSAAGVASPAAGDTSNLEDGLNIMALVLTVVTGIAVHYVSSSLNQINEQRREIDKEVDLARRLELVRAEINEHQLRMARVRFHQSFNEQHVEQVLAHAVDKGGATPIPEVMHDYATLKRIFQQYELPTNSSKKPPNSLQDVYQALDVTAQAKSLRLLLQREHIDSIRDFHEMIVLLPGLSDEARVRFEQIFRSFRDAIDDDRRSR